MNTTAHPPRHSVFEHRFYPRAAIAIAVIVVAGFTPNYVLRLLHDKSNLTLLVHLHGMAMVSWIALFLTQTMLVAKHRVDLHRRLGEFGAVLIGLMLLIGIPVLMNSVTRLVPDAHGMRYLLALAAFDGVGLLTFAGLAACAIVLRRRSDIHKRLMLLATLSLLGPAFGRLDEYANHFRSQNPAAILLLMLTCVAVCVGVDTFRHRRVHPAFIWGGAAAVAADVLTYAATTLLG